MSIVDIWQTVLIGLLIVIAALLNRRLNNHLTVLKLFLEIAKEKQNKP